MDSTTHGYSHWACVRIALREAGVSSFHMALAMYPFMTIEAARNPAAFLGGSLSWFFLVPAADLLRVPWRWWQLRSVALAFDGEHLRMVSRNGVLGLAAYEVAAYADSPRYLHIVPGRTDYQMTIHAELEGFEEMRQRLLAWIPQNAMVLPAVGKRRLRGSLLFGLIVAAAMTVWPWCARQLGFNSFAAGFWVVAIGIVGVFGYVAYRAWREEAYPEHRHNLPREFSW